MAVGGNLFFISLPTLGPSPRKCSESRAASRRFTQHPLYGAPLGDDSRGHGGFYQCHAAIAAKRRAGSYGISTPFQRLAEKFPEISSFLNFLLAALPQ